MSNQRFDKKSFYTGVNQKTQGYLPSTDPLYPPQTSWGYKDIRDLTDRDFNRILNTAAGRIDPELLEYNPDVAHRNALDYAIWHTGHGVYDGRIDSNLYNNLLARLSGREVNTQKESKTMRKLTASQARSIVAELDAVANEIENRGYNYGIPDRKTAFELAREVDEVSDYIERTASRRKQADVLRREPDEPYMEAFNEPGPLLQEDDEIYMDNFENPDEVRGVYERPESHVDELNPWSDGSKEQFSWRGKAQERPRHGEYLNSMTQKVSSRYTPRTAAGRRVQRRRGE